MLTKSEYSTSTSSLSTVFSGSLAELGSIMQAQSVSKLPGDQSQKSGTFRQRLKDRINKNKDHLFKVQQVIEESKREILELQDLKKLLFHGEVAPLSTFVDQVSNTTNSALLSLQRELALKEWDYEYVVYDRNVIWLDHKFKSEENSYLKHHSQAAKFFKHTKYDTEEQKYKQGCRDTERLLQNLDGLNQSCKHQIKQKNQKLREIKLRIRQKNQALLTKQEEYSRLTRLAGQDSSSPKITLSQVKEELRILRNEKMTLQECEYDCRTEVKKLAKSLKTLNNRDQVEASQVKALEEAVGKVTENWLNEIKKHSVVENSVVRLKTYLKKEKETKDKFLLEVNHKKKVGNDRYHATESKTMKAIDWNKIDNEDPTCLSTTQKIWEERKSKGQTKLKNQSNDTESQVEVSLISFDPDWEFSQSEWKLPFGTLSEAYKTPLKATSLQGSSTGTPNASSYSKRSFNEARTPESEFNGESYLKCSKILEETEEESVANLTPRLAGEGRQETGDLDGIKNSLFVTKSAEQDFSKDMFTTKTTLETEESSQNQYEIESTSTFNGKEQKESLLNLSNISSDGIINEERFCSPINAGRSSVPALNFPRGRNAVASLNSSWISSTNVSAVDSKLDKRLNEAPSLNSTLNSILNSTYKGSGLIPNHYKNRLSHGKVSINKLTKGVNKPAESCSKTPCAKSNRKDSQDSGSSWKSKKPSGDGFKQTHWNFTKNQRA